MRALCAATLHPVDWATGVVTVFRQIPSALAVNLVRPLQVKLKRPFQFVSLVVTARFVPVAVGVVIRESRPFVRVMEPRWLMVNRAFPAYAKFIR